MPKEKRRKKSSEKRKPKEIDPKDIQGLKYFKVLRPFLKRLRDVSTERDRAQNRQLHMDEYCILVHPVRLVCVTCSPHTSRGRRRGRNFSSTGPSSDGVLRIVTDMLDLPAEIIAELYRLRWTIELFFRMFKQLLGCRHLLSTKQNGVENQVYAALIACMLMSIYTGRAPNKRTFEMLRFYMHGMATIDEIVGHIEKQKSRSP
jgi:IS4 transposase